MMCFILSELKTDQFELRGRFVMENIFLQFATWPKECGYINMVLVLLY